MKITKSQLRKIIKEELAEAINPDQIGTLGDDPESFHQEPAKEVDNKKLNELVDEAIWHLESKSLLWAIEDGEMQRISGIVNRLLGIMQKMQGVLGTWNPEDWKE